MPPLFKKDGTPYQASDAGAFLEALAMRTTYANPAHTPKHALKLPFGQKEVAEDGHQKRLATVLRQKLALSNAIKTSYDEHLRPGGTQDALHDLGRYVSFRTGATFIPGPPKGWDGVIRKTLDFQTTYKEVAPPDVDGLKAFGPVNLKVVDRGYEANYAKVKDEIRMTLVCDDDAMYANVRSTVLGMAGLGGIAVIKDVEVRADLDECGYSGTNIVLQMPNGEPGEVQINTPNIMYGKMTPKDYKVQLRVRDDEYAILTKSYHDLVGGYGHALYEVYRTNRGNETGLTAAKLSKDYYALLRRHPRPAARECQELTDRIIAFRETNSEFDGHCLKDMLFVMRTRRSKVRSR